MNDDNRNLIESWHQVQSSWWCWPWDRPNVVIILCNTATLTAAVVNAIPEWCYLIQRLPTGWASAINRCLFGNYCKSSVLGFNDNRRKIGHREKRWRPLLPGGQIAKCEWWLYIFAHRRAYRKRGTRRFAWNRREMWWKSKIFHQARPWSDHIWWWPSIPLFLGIFDVLSNYNYGS